MNWVMADANSIGAVDRLVAVVRADDELRELWEALEVGLLTLRDVGLGFDAPDSDVRRVCAARDIWLVTNDVNNDGPDSLEAALAAERGDELPVLMVDQQAVLHDSPTCHSVALELLEKIADGDLLRGTRRVWLR